MTAPLPALALYDTPWARMTLLVSAAREMEKSLEVAVLYWRDGTERWRAQANDALNTARHVRAVLEMAAVE